MQLAGDTLYWLGSNALYTVAKTGGVVKKLLAPKYGVRWFTTDDKFVFYVTTVGAAQTGPANLLKVAR